uniref:Trace amine-associated receptor 1 n=1 Tax=Callorhinchus milii TaxID=7868 RepID=A0A4W3HWN2_CALMI
MDISVHENTESMQLCYESVNGSCPRAIRSTGVRITLYLLAVLAILVTLFGNMLVIISIAHFKQLHTPTNYLVFSLAIADFLLGCIVMPYSLIRSIESCWYFGILFCKLHTSFDLVLCAASIIHLCCISVDRYYAVCDPLKYKTTITVSTVLIMICLSWALSFLVGFVIIFLELHLIEIKDFYYHEIACFGGCTLMMGKVCALVYSTISFYFPAFIMVNVILCVNKNLFPSFVMSD